MFPPVPILAMQYTYSTHFRHPEILGNVQEYKFLTFLTQSSTRRLNLLLARDVRLIGKPVQIRHGPATVIVEG